ncbi:lysozyme [Tenacibaculum sp. 190524A05c]|uniref:lysozyme n=1 Tax=Tenacibaculum platacis TaxID=3137852 RepID=UPI0031FA8F21
MAIEKRKPVKINNFSLAIEEKSPHETSDYIAKRIQEATEEVLKKIEAKKKLESYLSDSENTVSEEKEANKIPSISDSSINNGQNNIGSNSASNGSSLSSIGVINKTENSIFNDANGVTNNDFTSTNVSIGNTINNQGFEGFDIGKKNIKSRSKFNDSTGFKELLIKEIEKRYLTEKASSFDPLKTDYWLDTIKKIRETDSLKTLVELPENKELKALHDELLVSILSGLNLYGNISGENILKGKTEKKLTKEKLRSFIIQEIEDKFLSEEKLPKEKLSYWESILAQLKNTDITLESILNYHPELFLFLDLLTTPDLDVITPGLLKINTEVYVAFRKIYPKNLANDKIYIKLGELKDKTGNSLSKKHVKVNEKGSLFAIGKELKFSIVELKELRANTNWIVYKKKEGKKGKYEVIEKYVDQNELVKQFKEPGKYIIEAYGKNAYFLINKGKTAYKEVIIKEPAIKQVEVVGYKKSGFKTATNQSLAFKITAADIGEITKIPNIKWYVCRKEEGEKEYTKTEIKEAANSLELNHQFLENGDYMIEVTSGSVGNLVSKTISFKVKEPAVAKLEVEGQKGKKFRIRKDESLTFKVTAADVGDVVNIPNIKWYLSYKKKGAANYTEQELTDSATNLECKHKFKEEGNYIIKVTSGSEGNVVIKSINFSVGKNYPLGIKIDKDRVLHGTKQVVKCEVTGYKIEPANKEEISQTKWVIYKKAGAVYTPEGIKKIEEESHIYLAKGRKFEFVLDKEGDYVVEAYSNSSDYKKGKLTKSCKVIEVYYPQVLEASWKDEYTNEKLVTGLHSKNNYIYAQISDFNEQSVGIHMHVNGKKITNQPFITKTDNNGVINYMLNDLEAHKKHLSLMDKKNTMLHFSLVGIINNKEYKFKKPVYNPKSAVIEVNTEERITKTFFLYKNNIVSKDDKIPYGSQITAVVETINLKGKKIAFKIYREASLIDGGIDSGEAIVNEYGKAEFTFKLKLDWYELGIGMYDRYYIAAEVVNGVNLIPWYKSFKDNYITATREKVKEAIVQISKPKFISDHGDWHDPVINPHYRGFYAAHGLNPHTTKKDHNPYASLYFNSNSKIEGKKHYGIDNRSKKSHFGNDIYGPVGTPVYAMFTGEISEYLYKNNTKGFTLTYKSNEKFKDGTKQELDYLHLCNFRENDFFFYGHNKSDNYYKYEDFKDGKLISSDLSSAGGYSMKKQRNAYYVKYNKNENKLIIDNVTIDLNKAKRVCKHTGIVQKGDIIGYIGMTGNARGNRKQAHLHINFRGISTPYFKEYKQYIQLDKKGNNASYHDGFIPSSQWRDKSRLGKRKNISSLSLSWKGKLFIKHWEQYREFLYDDNKKTEDAHCTIGYGYKVHSGPCRFDGKGDEKPFKNGITELEAEKLFNKKLIEFEKQIKSKINVPLYQHEFDAVVSYVYNLGISKITRLFKRLNEKKYSEAVKEIWGKNKKLEKRRKKEQKMFSSGIYDSFH